MNTHVYIDNFRGFSDALIPINQVNFLVGENSTGKTSFLELIEVFSDMSFWFFEPRYGVPGTPTRHFLDLVSASSSSKKSFCVGAIGMAGGEDSSLCGMLVTYSNSEGRPVPTRVSIIKGESLRTIDGRLWLGKTGDKYKTRTRTCISQRAEETTTDALRRLVAAHKLNTSFKITEVREEVQGGPLFMRFEDFLFNGVGFNEREVSVPFPFMSNFVELAPIRTKPKRTYDAPQTGFSPEGDHTPYVIKKRLSNKTQAEAFLVFLERAGKNSGLFKSVTVKPYGTGPQAPFEMRIVLGKAALGLENVGYGVSQALPLIVEMFVRPKRTAFAIQQPEVHLHPKAQATFGDLIAELARSDDKRFMIETHSDFTIDRFRLNIRQHGAIPSQLLFFERTESVNIVTPIAIQSNGDLDSDQPDSYRTFFFNESLELLS